METVNPNAKEGIMKRWNDGIRESWNTGTVEWWNNGLREQKGIFFCM